jgi:hypothetical protein
VDWGVIESLKRRNRWKFVGVLLEKMEKMDSGNGLVQAVKTINIKEVICMIAEAWDEILPTTLSKSWKKVWPNMQQDTDLDMEKSVEPDVEIETTAIADEMRNLQGCEDIQKTDVIEWLATDDTAYCSTDLDDNEIIVAVTHNAASEPADTENFGSDTEEAFLKVTHSEGKAALEMALRF